MKILLADDHVLFRDALIQFIRSLRPEWTVLAASTFDEAEEMLRKTESRTTGQPDISLLLLDLRMPGMHGLQGLEVIRARYPELKTAILSGMANEAQVRQAMEMGARAFFPKTLPGKSLIAAIALVSDGQKFVPVDDTGTRIMPAYYDDKANADSQEELTAEQDLLKTLSRREREVLGYLAKGMSNKEIANILDLQVATIKLHVGGICKKLDADNRTQAAIIAHKAGFKTG